MCYSLDITLNILIFYLILIRDMKYLNVSIFVDEESDFSLFLSGRIDFLDLNFLDRFNTRRTKEWLISWIMPKILIRLLVHLELVANLIVFDYDLLLVIDANKALDRRCATTRHNILISHLEELKKVLTLVINRFQICLYAYLIKILPLVIWIQGREGLDLYYLVVVVEDLDELLI